MKRICSALTAGEEATVDRLAPSAPSPLWTSKQAAEYLHLHERTVIRLAAAGIIPAIKLGRCWRFVPEELHRWAREQSSNGLKLSPVPQSGKEH